MRMCVGGGNHMCKSCCNVYVQCMVHVQALCTHTSEHIPMFLTSTPFSFPNPSPLSLTRLTALGKQMGRLPVEPMFARALLCAVESGCAKQVLAITAMVSTDAPFFLRCVDHVDYVDHVDHVDFMYQLSCLHTIKTLSHCTNTHPTHPQIIKKKKHNPPTTPTTTTPTATAPMLHPMKTKRTPHPPHAPTLPSAL